MVDIVPEADLRVWRSFLGAHAASVGRIEAELEERRLIPLEWYDVLVAIQLAKDHRLRLMDIAQQLVLTRSNATRLIDRLEAIGLIRRERHEGDRRGTSAVLTAAGRQALRRAWPVYAKGIKQYFLSALKPAEVAVVGTALARVEQRARPLRPILRRRR